MFFHEGMKSNVACALKLDTSRKGWYEIMSKILGKKKGIDYNWDAKEGMLHVSGQIDAQKILKIVRLNKKIVELQYMRTENHHLSGGALPPYHGGYYPPPPPMPQPYYNYQEDYNPYLPQLPYHY